MSDRRDRRRESEPAPDGGRPAGDRGASFLDDLLSSVLTVLSIGVLLFAVSGVWPPLVAIESPSMTPNIKTGDMVFVMEEHRFASTHQIGETGVVTAHRGRQVGYGKFDLPGDVIVYEPRGDPDATPIIHRAAFWVNESENWYPKAQQQYLSTGASNCEAARYCPAPHDGFVTLGDANPRYDQAVGRTPPVKPEWVVGTGEFRIQSLGWLRLRAAGAPTGPVRGVDAATVAVG